MQPALSHLTLTGLLAVLASQVAGNANAQAVSNSQDREAIEEIVVTGSRIRRRDAIAPSPISTLERDDLLLAPQRTLEETLNRMPQLTPDFGRTSNNPGNGTANLNLRGMGSERTLVLLNSRRVAPSGVGSAVDINNIPQFLIDRVEIVTGGASTAYGSDALAGVVNFITRDDFEGITFEAGYGVTEKGDAEYTDLSAAFGTSIADGRGNVVVYGGYYDRTPLFASARDLTSDTLLEDGAGEVVEAGSFTVPEGVLFSPVPGVGFPIFNPDGTWRSFINPDDQYNYAPYNFLQTPLKRSSVGIMGEFSIDDDYEVYLEISFSSNQSGQELAPVPMTEFVDVNIDNPVLTPETAQMLQENFADPESVNPGIASFSFSRRLSELGDRITDQERSYWRNVLGLRGSLGGSWEIDGWLSYTVSDEETLLRNDGSPSRVLQGLLVDPQTGQCFDTSDGCVPVDVFGEGRLSANAVDYIRYGVLKNTTERTQKLASVVVSGSPGENWAGPVDIASGIEWRSDEVDFRADDVLFSGDTLGYRGEAPVDGAESVTELYTEAYIPLLGGVAAAESLAIELGARYSRYDRAGGVWTYKYGGNWQINDSLRLRAMWQRSVRAPNNLELFQRQYVETQNFVGNFDLVDPCSASQDPIGSGFAEACVLQGLDFGDLAGFEAIPFLPVDYIRGGNEDLEAEEADTFTAGLVYTPDNAANWSFALDYYDIDISDGIGEIVARDICFDLANAANIFCDKIRRVADPGNAVYGNVYEVEELFNNRGRISTRGVDTQLNFNVNLAESLAIFEGQASLTGSLVWTHLLALKYQPNPVSTIESCVGYFHSPCTGVTSSSTAPEDRVSGYFTYRTGGLSLSFFAQWISDIRSYLFVEASQNAEPAPVLAVPEIGSEFRLDTSVAYQFNDTVAARLGITNLFDRDSPLIPGLEGNTDTQLYDPFGRAYSLSITVQFDP